MDAGVLRSQEAGTAGLANPIPFHVRLLAVLACGATSVVWLWFSSPASNYFLSVAALVPVLLFSPIVHLVLEELHATSAVYHFRRHVPLLRSRFYAFAVFFTAAAMMSILVQLPLRARFELSRPAMNALVSEVLANPDAPRPATMRVGWYVIETAPDRSQRDDGALMFHLPGTDAGFTYSRTPIDGYPGGQLEAAGGSLGGGWYWFHDE